MADNDGKVENTSPANEWEVVTLTASTYAAAPSPEQVELNITDKRGAAVEHEAETSSAMLMSRHFAYPQRSHEKLQLEPEDIEISDIKKIEHIVSDVGVDEGNISEKTDENKWNEIQYFDEKDNSLFLHGVKSTEETNFQGLNAIEKELSLYSPSKGSSFHSETTTDGSVRHEEEAIIYKQVEPCQGGLDSVKPQLPNSVKEDENMSGYFEAWWKNYGASVYAQAKEANAFWSVFVAATVMGLVILGQHWQQERWQVLQLRWHFAISNEKMDWMLSPLSRFKDVIAGGNGMGFLTRRSSLSEN